MIKTETIPVYGMMCEHCVKAVKMALEGIDGVTGTEVRDVIAQLRSLDLLDRVHGILRNRVRWMRP